jgi:4-coumarate--CoA ligase
MRQDITQSQMLIYSPFSLVCFSNLKDKIYSNYLPVDPNPHCLSQEDTKIHIDAANTANYLTKAHARTLTENFAYSFRNLFGIGANGHSKDVVVGFSSLQILLPLAFYGTIAAGGIFSCASHSFTASELAQQIRQGGGKLLICSADLVDVGIEAARQCGLSLDRVLVLESDYGNWSLKTIDGKLDCCTEKSLTWQRITDPQELEYSIINLLYSSGTTGAPKGKINTVTRKVQADMVFSRHAIKQYDGFASMDFFPSRPGVGNSACAIR